MFRLTEIGKPMKLRSVPIISGYVELIIGISISVLWHPTLTPWWWIESLLVVALLLKGFRDLWIGYFATNEKVERMVTGGSPCETPTEPGKVNSEEAELKEIQQAIVGEAFAFSERASAGIDKDMESLLDELDAPRFRRIICDDDQKSNFSNVDQSYLAIEGMAFFLHCINRLSFRRNSEALREKVFDPTVDEVVREFVKIIRSNSGNILEESTLNRDLRELISERELEYARSISVLGKSTEDDSGAWQAAGRRITEEITKQLGFQPERRRAPLAMNMLEQIIRVELLRGFKEMAETKD